MSGANGFWKLEHDDLTAVLARHDLSWETARVYLAVADLTRGYSKERDIISLSQIAERAGMYQAGKDGSRRPDCAHVARAWGVLRGKGLVGRERAEGQGVYRWVIWPLPPPPTAEAGSTAKAGSSNTAGSGSSTTAEAGRETTAKAGTHQERKKYSKKRKEVTAASDEPTPDSRVKFFIDWFSENYKAALGRPYVVTQGKDQKLVKDKLKQLDCIDVCALAVLKRAAQRMLADEWWGEKSDIGLLSRKLNEWRSNGKARPEKQDGKPRTGLRMYPLPPIFTRKKETGGAGND